MSFTHHNNSEKLAQDESPFIHLSTNPLYIDVLCVTCYECVKFHDVDKHSQVCMGMKNSSGDTTGDSGKLNLARDMKNVVRKGNFHNNGIFSELYDDDVNERILKLKKSIKSRLVEIQLQDNSNSLIDHYSNLHAIALNIYENN